MQRSPKAIRSGRSAGPNPVRGQHRALAALAIALLSVVGVVGWRIARPSGSVPGPIVLISIDTLRADHLPAYGYTKVGTPAIDSLAADGVVFDRAYAHSPQTLPSHVSILSGRLPFEHGVRDNVGFTVSEKERTLAALLHERGYATAGIASAYVLRPETGMGRAFDYYDVTLPPSSGEVAVGDLQRDGMASLEAARRWLAGRPSDRLFLFFHIYEPHAPYAPPSRYRHYAPYDGEIAYSDEVVGGLLETLKSENLYDPALIILLSDHGEGLGDHGEHEHGVFLYSETIRVPLVVKLPKQRNAGRRVATPVQHIDLVPTILDLLHTAPPSGLRGRSLRPVFDGGSIPEQPLYAEALYARYHFGWSELYALTDARYRLIRAPRDELYDLARDAGERRNVASERQSTSAGMRSALQRLMSGSRIDAPAGVAAEVQERLRALGYVGTQVSTDSGSGLDRLPNPRDRIQVLEDQRAALALVQAGRTDEALVRLRAIVDNNPQMGEVWAEIGGLLVRRGRLEEAIAAYRRLVEVAPEDPTGLINVADCLVQLGRLDEARAQASLAATTIPREDGRWRGKAHQTLALIAIARRDAEAARTEARRANEADPTLPLPDVVDGLILYNAGQFAEAVPVFERALEKSASRAIQVQDLRYYLADALGHLERYGEAERYFRDEIRLFPYNLRARAGLAILLRVTGRVDASNRLVESLAAASTPEGFALAEKLWTMFGERARAGAVRERRKAVAARPITSRESAR